MWDPQIILHYVSLSDYLPDNPADLVEPESSGEVVAGVKYLVRCRTMFLAELFSQGLWCLRLGWAVYFAIYLSRYFFQIFGNIKIFGNSFLEFIFRASRFPNRAFVGILPCIYGIDFGVFLTFYIFERIDFVLNKIVILDPSGMPI